jgi:hypothetical protein
MDNLKGQYISSSERKVLSLMAKVFVKSLFQKNGTRSKD